MWDFITSCKVTGNAECFGNAMKVWIERPNVCNKLISCATVTEVENVNTFDNGKLKQILMKLKMVNQGNFDKIIVRKLVPRKSTFNEASELVYVKKNKYIFVAFEKDDTEYLDRNCFKIEFDEINNEMSLHQTNFLGEQEKHECLQDAEIIVDDSCLMQISETLKCETEIANTQSTNLNAEKKCNQIQKEKKVFISTCKEISALKSSETTTGDSQLNRRKHIDSDSAENLHCKKKFKVAEEICLSKCSNESVGSSHKEKDLPTSSKCCNDVDKTYNSAKQIVICHNQPKKSRKRSCVPNISWIVKRLFPILCKWTEEEFQKLATNQQPSFSLPPSLSLISKESYSQKYEDLKMKYGKKMAEIWPEVTDPQKFVYEDVAIATYLLLLWEDERCQNDLTFKQSFVDLGCGNGLLTFILTCEGHTGKGVDLRRRKIWNVYPSNVVLEEAVIEPTNEKPYVGFDWLLGNHSDELTPWIPVMASRLGYNVRYWVLPCCFFDFYGKYGRKQSLCGQYEEYLSFVANVGRTCGFHVGTDVMRIPSTKRVCQVGMKKSYAVVDHDLWLEKANKLVTKDGEDFVAREKVERVKNCTKLPKDLQTHVVVTTVHKLLETIRIKEVIRGAETISWNCGGSLKLCKIVKLFQPSILKSMKAECGGLQTLFKNNHQIFLVSGGMVCLRDWTNKNHIRINNGKKNSRMDVKAIKTRDCWFHFNHPQKCPLTDEACTFKHDGQ